MLVREQNHGQIFCVSPATTQGRGSHLPFRPLTITHDVARHSPAEEVTWLRLDALTVDRIGRVMASVQGQAAPYRGETGRGLPVRPDLVLDRLLRDRVCDGVADCCVLPHAE